MNIARSLDKPAVPRSKKRRRVRRIKMTFRLFILLTCLVSAGFTFYWTTIGVGMLWHNWGSPAFETAWTWLEGLSSAERFMWLNRLGWGAVVIGLLTSLWVYMRESRFSKWVAIVCFTYSYGFLWHTAWLVLKSFFDMGGWTENGLIGAAVLGYVSIIAQTRLPKPLPANEERS